MLKYKIATQPTVEPITLAEAKLHCRVTGTTDDTLITRLISAARVYAEGAIGKALAAKTVTAVCDSFPASGVIRLPVSPITALTSLKYKDKDGAETDITTDVITDDFSHPSQLLLKTDLSWPTATLYQVNPITIVYAAGATPTDNIKAAMLLLIGHWYENREEVIVGQESFTVPFAADALLQQERHGLT